MVLMATTAMIFAALTSAYFMRRGFSGDWQSMPAPPVLWANTAMLLLSSGMVERARWNLHAGRRAAFNSWWGGAVLAGALFLLAQAGVWRQLNSAGFHAANNPSIAFFYLLTAAHAVHVAGSLGALAYVGFHALRFTMGPSRRTGAEVAAVFWHFLTGLWIFLLLLFSVWG
jgi:cytochrome c oxidase subunit 3